MDCLKPQLFLLPLYNPYFSMSLRNTTYSRQRNLISLGAAKGFEENKNEN